MKLLAVKHKSCKILNNKQYFKFLILIFLTLELKIKIKFTYISET